jgi:hypothetical protein
MLKQHAAHPTVPIVERMDHLETAVSHQRLL